MRIFLAALAATSAVASAVVAADKPLIGPAAAWVKTSVPPPDLTKSEDGPVRVLQLDQQVDLQPGRLTTYSEVTFKIQTPQGLTAGNLSFPWRPDTDVPTVHKVLIRRGKETIDVLASGQTFTVVRREQNLDNATLDGVLTANIQPEGLQVGDIVDFAVSISSSDPTLKGHVEDIASAWNGFPIDHAHLRMQWPTTLPVRLRQTASLPVLKPVKTGMTTAVELSLNDLKPFSPPKGAPARYTIGRLVEITDYASWADVAALMGPLYVKASVVPTQGPLRTELERIQGLSTDPRVRTEAALALVQDRVRYVALAMGTGGYVPADAQTTWSRRFGDCKAKTALLLALLHAMGVQAEPVVVSTTFGDGLDARLPLVGLFNHVLVRASVDGRTVWLDGTRTGDTRLDRLTTPNFGWGLPLLAQGAALVRMTPPPLATPMLDTAIRIDASAGISTLAPTSIETVLRGDEAIVVNASIAALVGDARDRALKDYWKKQYDFIEVKSASASFDQATGEQRLSMTGAAKLDWANGEYQTDGTDVGYKADFSREPGPDRDAPFAVAYPFFTRTRETILLPKGFRDLKIGSGMDVDQTAGGIAYRRHATVAHDAFTIETTAQSLVAEFPAKNAAAEQATLRMLADRRASLRMPSNYAYTGKDLAAVRADVPTTSQGYVDRAIIFKGRDLPQEALLDYDKAVALDPSNVYAWANRALTRVELADLPGAKSDLARADALEPSFAQNDIVRGMIAEAEHRPHDAIDLYTKAIQREPENGFPIGRRANAYAQLGLAGPAVADAAAAIKLDPGWIDLYSLRAGYDLGKGDFARAIAEMRAAIAVDPERAFAHVAAARIYAQCDRTADALQEYDRAISLAPEAYIFAERSRHRPIEDRLARQADVDAALKRDPKSKDALIALAILQRDEGNTKAAISTVSQLLAASPDDAKLLAQRAQLYYRNREDAPALTDASAALKRDPANVDLYLLRANVFLHQGKIEAALGEANAVQSANPASTYAQVVAAKVFSANHRNVEAMKAYDRALAIHPEAYIYLNRGLTRPATDAVGRRADIDAALKLDPSLPEAIDEKARLQTDGGDFAGAIATYDSGLAKSPDSLDLLVGRGIVYARMGDRTRAEKDFASARGRASGAVEFNNMCWSKAVAGVALESALNDCDTALAKAPSVAGFIDSRGLVLLRLGRLDDAIFNYDRALQKSPDLAASLFGRAVAWSRKGDLAKSHNDVAAAARIDPEVQATFERYGVKL